MSWLDKIRNGSKAKKIRVIWTITIVSFVVLVAAWIIIGNYSKGKKKDLTIFQTLGKGIKDVSHQDPKKAASQPPLPFQQNQ